MVEQGVRVGGLGGDEGGVSEDGRVGDKLDVLGSVGVEACVGRQVGDVGRPDGRAHAPKVLGDGEFVCGRAVDLQPEDRGGDLLVLRLEEVGRLEVWRERERVTEEDAEEVAFRRHVVRGSHGREGLGLGAWVPLVKMLNDTAAGCRLSSNRRCGAGR